MKATICLWCASLTLVTAQAYLPPVDERAGVKVEIGSFPQTPPRRGKKPASNPLGLTEVQAGAPRAFPVTLENRTDTSVTGVLDVWMNDDWLVAGEQGTLTLGPRETVTRTFMGMAKPRALDALYPVHARFTPVGAKAEDAPHPIAVFRFLNSGAPRAVRKAAPPKPVPPPTEADWAMRQRAACAAARAALEAGTDAAAGRWLLEAGDGRFGAGVAYGPHGLIDGALAFTDGTRDVVFRGFAADVAKDGPSAPTAQAAIRAEKGTLRIAWSLPGAARNAFGFPRLARLAVGPASERLHRVYAGFGNVIEGPKSFTLAANANALSTRHVGADYANGLSVVQAVDVPPDRLVCKGGENLFALEAHHDATFTFVPSSKGAFAAARRFRAVSGYRASPGLARLGSRMCLDQWDGDYAEAAADIAAAAKYGLVDAIFVKHDWQRWGFDYRLPEIWPPHGDATAFGALRDACRAAGILFAPHDNYTDLYPDAGMFSYGLVTFNLNGTPQKSWVNAGRQALAYRWAPHAFLPWCRRNAALLKAGCDPDAVFIDVFTAHGPFDYLDRDGRFHTKMETSAGWAKGFETYRACLGRPDAVCMSEGGQDHLVGTADAGQSDHHSAAKLVGAANFADAERTPWHDIVTHGYYVLFAGGLGNRYQEGTDAPLHGYASDDYLSNAIIGGRNPMCYGPFSRKAVMTYWLQHDVCAELGRSEFLSLDYDGNIHRQHTVFSDGGEVWANRQTNVAWRLPNGIVLPPYGYYAKTRGTESAIAEKDGVRCAWARAADVSFFDARTPADGRKASASVVRAARVAPDRLRLTVAWETRRPLRGYRPFVHVCTPDGAREGIVFQPTLALTQKMLETPGRYEVPVDLAVPARTAAGTYVVRYGAWHTATGGRLEISGGREDGVKRICAGEIVVAAQDGRVTDVAWRPDAPLNVQTPRDRLLGINRARVAVDFGGVKTDGAFRLAHPSAGAWTLTPLPDAGAFTAEIDVGAVGASDARVVAVEAVDAAADAAPPAWRQTGRLLALAADARAFAYRIRFERRPDDKHNDNQ